MIEEVFENLVEQFSDPFTFYRELIQNAMDAGSNLVDVQVEYLEERSMVLVTVTDSGEGMNFKIIQDQLTRLFSSSKEEDMTKIGKFGIGFVSVFAIRPEVVTVETGRDGEYWRVIFDGTTDFQCLTLDNPVEGTTIRVYKPLRKEDLEEFTRRSRDTISFWCRYSDTEVLFNGEKINEDMMVDSPCSVHHQQPGTEIVCGFTSSALPAFGMYNRGLTLKEGRQDVYPGVTYRIRSRYLEHTLTRDNVLEDENYKKAMIILDQTVRQELTGRFYALVQEAGQKRDMDRLNELFASASVVLTAWRKRLTKAWWSRPLFPCLHGPPLSLQELREAAFWEGAVYVDTRETQVSQDLARYKIPVLLGEPDSSPAHLAASITGKPVRLASGSVATPIHLPPETRRVEVSRLEGRLVNLLKCGDTSIRWVRLADFYYEGSCVTHLPCLAQLHSGEPIRLYHRGFWRSLQKYPGLLLLNHRHSLVNRALALAEQNPVLSAFVLAKAALLQDGLPGALEAKIVGRSM